MGDAKGGSATGPSVVVAVIDTGIDYDGNGVVDDVYGADYSGSSPSGDPIDRQGHGTHCSGIIAATPNNGKGIAGVASYHQGKVKLMALKGLSDSGGGTISGLLSCLNYAVDKGAKISSNSWGGGTVNGIEDVWDAVLRNNLDHLFVAAAGNSNREITDSYTSMTCPHVSGLAALIMTMRDNMSAHEVRQLIEANVRVKSEYASFVSSGGLIDAGATIKALKGGSGNDTTPEPPTCDYAPYCAIVDCSKNGSAALCPDQCKTTKTIKIRTEAWGYENSYAIGTCVSTQQYATRKNYEEECTLAPGAHNLDCKCTYGDGWHGGYVEIDGVQYCKDFTSGHSKTVSVTW